MQTTLHNTIKLLPKPGLDVPVPAEGKDERSALFWQCVIMKWDRDCAVNVELLDVVTVLWALGRG